ncbi:MAG: YkgJ family cysteine cluster protein [Spirochaetales bacterium]|nr:YkgJ family cysteine cluster protein [Spirochaetales bacterium]
MAVYRGKYILEGLDEITPDMEHNLDIAYDICMSYRDNFPCEMCGRCCHQPNIIIRPEEIDRVASAANLTPFMFKRNYVVEMPDGRFLINKQNDGPCPFLGEDKRCTIWKDRPQICDDFPYAVSMFMSRCIWPLRTLMPTS